MGLGRIKVKLDIAIIGRDVGFGLEGICVISYLLYDMIGDNTLHRVGCQFK